MKASEVTVPGFYWYYVNDEPPAWTVVRVDKEYQTLPDLYVYWPGSEEDERLQNCDGEFVGPIPPPLA